MTKISPETGLPKLPDGYVWNVREREPSQYGTVVGRPGSYIVEIVEMATGWSLRRRSITGLDDASVARAANDIYVRFSAYLSEQEARKRLLGMFPPNRVRS
ncbi:hypothetical protein ABZX73_16360 [Brevibacterium casei]